MNTIFQNSEITCFQDAAGAIVYRTDEDLFDGTSRGNCVNQDQERHHKVDQSARHNLRRRFYERKIETKSVASPLAEVLRHIIFH